MNNLPKDIISYIYEFDNTYKLKYKNCITELQQKIYFIKINQQIKHLKYKPNYILPKYFIKSINFYKILNIIND